MKCLLVRDYFEEDPMTHSYGFNEDENEIIGITPGWRSINFLTGEHSIYEGDDAVEGNRSYSVTRGIGNASNPFLSEPSCPFYAHPGEQFNISFDINADVNFYGDIHTGPIRVSEGDMPLGAYLNAVDKVEAGDLIMSGTKEWQTQTIVTTAEITGYYILVLQFGWIDIPNGDEVRFLIDNVKIERVSSYPDVYSDMGTGTAVELNNMVYSRIYVDAFRNLHIDMNDEYSKSNVVLFDITGKQILKEQIYGSDMIQLPQQIKSGIYIAQIQDEKGAVGVSKIFIR